MTQRRRLAFGIAGASVFLSFLATVAGAQVTTGTIAGTVRDSTGGVAAGATVTVTETGKGTSSTYVTDANGAYAAPFLIKRIPIRNFRLQFRADAFNLFNSPQLGFPNANIGSASAGRITTTIGDNRQMQFALKLDW